MQVGDLLRPKCQFNFERLGFAVLLNIDEGSAIIVWIDEQINNRMSLRLLQNNMEVVCK